MRPLIFASIVAPLLVAASAPLQPAAGPLDQRLRQARAEQAAAEAETARLERAAANALGEAERLNAQQLATAQAIEAAEAHITAAGVQYRLCLLYTSPSPRDTERSRMPSSA